MAEVTITARNRIVLPLEARKALGVHGGDALLVIVKGNSVILMAKPTSWTKALRGLGKLEYSDNYLENERASWD